MQQFDDCALKKVVLARQQTMHFGAQFSSLNVIRKWKYGGHEGGHLFRMKPSEGQQEFFGCTPERLFQIQKPQLATVLFVPKPWPGHGHVDRHNKLMKNCYGIYLHPPKIVKKIH
jgi:hypothetical protein